MPRHCRDVEYMVHGNFRHVVEGTYSPRVGRTGMIGASGDVYFKSPDEAALFAVRHALSGALPGDRPVPVRMSVLVHSERGARCYGGAPAVQSYREDPNASAFDDFTISARSHGRVR
jgi:hypothetical protein